MDDSDSPSALLGSHRSARLWCDTCPPAWTTKTPRASGLGVSYGAGDENRTRALSLGSGCLLLRARYGHGAAKTGGQSACTDGHCVGRGLGRTSGWVTPLHAHRAGSTPFCGLPVRSMRHPVDHSANGYQRVRSPIPGRSGLSDGCARCCDHSFIGPLCPSRCQPR